MCFEKVAVLGNVLENLKKVNCFSNIPKTVFFEQDIFSMIEKFPKFQKIYLPAFYVASLIL
jgi:hypothetical protein